MLQKREGLTEESCARRPKRTQFAATQTSNRRELLWEGAQERRNDTSESTGGASSTAQDIENKRGRTDQERRQIPPSLPHLEDSAFILLFPGREKSKDRSDKSKTILSKSRKRRPKLRIRPVAFPESDNATKREKDAARIPDKDSSLKGAFSAKKTVVGVDCPGLARFPELASDSSEIERPVKYQVSTPRPNLRLPARRRIEPRFDQREGGVPSLSRYPRLSKRAETDRSSYLDRLSIPIL
mmetsp:Transcript_51988/g.156011  ORF Transcript_51988/g.156011 Transcript_51988/m.156011 type:complete len:241 (-) Transcript_51988:110-832(-)